MLGHIPQPFNARWSVMRIRGATHDLAPLPGPFPPSSFRLLGGFFFFVGCFLRRVSSIFADVRRSSTYWVSALGSAARRRRWAGDSGWLGDLTVMGVGVSIS